MSRTQRLDRFISQNSVRVSIGAGQNETDVYVLQRCRVACGTQTIAPGQSRYITVGQMYYADATLQHMPSVTIEPVLAVMPTDKGVSLPIPNRALDSIAIAVNNPSDLPVPHAALYPVPERQPLVLADLREPGDQLLVRDPNTGYDWIRLHVSAGLRSATDNTPVMSDQSYFDESSGLLTLPGLVLMPETEPPVFELISFE